MTQKKYFSIYEIIDLLGKDPIRDKLLCMMKDNQELFFKSKGSATKHQAWEGGYIDHITECCNIAIKLYETLNTLRPLPFSLNDCIIVMFLHDLEKPWLYGGEVSFKKRDDRSLFREEMLKRYDIILTKEQKIAFKYVEGEGTDYSESERVMNPLGALCHCCDIISGRLWFDQPNSQSKQW